MHILFERPCLVAGCDTSGFLEGFSIDLKEAKVARVCRKGHRVEQTLHLVHVDKALLAQINDRLLAGLVELGIMGGVE